MAYFWLILAALIDSSLSANIGSFTSTIINPSFPAHSIPVFVYYPQPTSSKDPLPTIVFAHGFECSATEYTWVYEDIVPLGYIVAYINSYTGHIFNQTQFAIDQRYTLEWLNTVVNNNKSSPLYGVIDTTKSLAAGHSEGGGTCLTSSGSPYVNSLFKYKFNSIFVMAPCGQDGTVESAQQIKIPTFAFTGTMDCACPSEEAKHLIDAIPSSTCKYYIDVTNGTHCHWMNPELVVAVACEEGEDLLCKVLRPNKNVTISEKKQLQIGSKYMQLFLNATIKDNGQNQQDFSKIATDLNSDKSNGVMSEVQISEGCSNM
eukprot:819969_1